MAARRNKSQARRTGGGNSTPGWMWLIIGAVLAGLAFLVVPGLRKADGFDPLRPTPNPDAQPPAQIAEVDTDAVAPAAERTAKPAPAVVEDEQPKPTRYEFYDVLQGKEVQMSDAELAASARAEQERRARAERAAAAAAATAAAAAAQQPASTPVAAAPRPIEEAPAASPAPAAARPATTNPAPAAAKPVAAPARSEATEVASAAPARANYILQAGAFGASGDAEATKAKIAMLGLSARVESAQINGKTVYRVRMGPYGSASELSEAKQKLANGGLPAIAIKAE